MQNLACDRPGRFVSAYCFRKDRAVVPSGKTLWHSHYFGQVYAEVVVAGAGLVGAVDVSQSPWIEVRQISNPSDLTTAQARFGLGAGELSTLILAKEIHADLIILDDRRARRLAQKESFKLQGSIGLLEACFRRGYLPDLRQAYSQLLSKGV